MAHRRTSDRLLSVFANPVGRFGESVQRVAATIGSREG